MSAICTTHRAIKILDEVKQSHQEVIITNRGKPIAKVVHIDQDDTKDPLLGAMEGIGRTVDSLTEPVTSHTEWELD
jgi:antitoxin (DNA-binding transcriptional repressor) of toxin-antitoxin stability system